MLMLAQVFNLVEMRLSRLRMALDLRLYLWLLLVSGLTPFRSHHVTAQAYLVAS